MEPTLYTKGLVPLAASSASAARREALQEPADTKAHTENKTATSAATLVIKGLVLYGYHGALEQEKVLGGKYEIDVILTYNAYKASMTDDLQDALNYQDVVAVVERLWRKTRWNLLESMAAELLAGIIEEFAEIQKCVVQVRKYAVPLGVPVEYVEIRLSASRGALPV